MLVAPRPTTRTTSAITTRSPGESIESIWQGFGGGVSESTGFPCWPHRSDVSGWDCPAEDADQTALIASIQQTAKIHPQVAQRDQTVPQSSCEQP